MSIEKYVQNAKDILAMLEAEPDYTPIMTRFCSSGYNINDLKKAVNECGTSYCLAGKQAQLDGFPNEFIDITGVFDFVTYSESKCGFGFFTGNWNYIYGAKWPNTRESAIERCKYIIENYKCGKVEV